MHHLMLTSSLGETCLFLLSWPGSSLQFQLQAATENGNVGTLFWLLQLQKSPVKSRQDFRFLPSSVVLLCNARSGYIICSITDKRQGRLYRIVCIGVCNCNYMFVVQNETGDGFGALALYVCLDLCMGKQLHHTNGLQLGIQDLNIGRHPDYWEYLCIFNVRLQEIWSRRLITFLILCFWDFVWILALAKCHCLFSWKVKVKGRWQRGRSQGGPEKILSCDGRPIVTITPWSLKFQ